MPTQHVDMATPGAQLGVVGWMGVNGDALTHERLEETTKLFDALTPSGC